jgi:elongation factor Ts
MKKTMLSPAEDAESDLLEQRPWSRTNKNNMEITAQLVKRLREETDGPMMECKKALQQAAEELGDSATEDAVFSRAKEILKEGGKLQAGKRVDRTVSQGTVAVGRSGSTAAAVALLCETDFVARNHENKMNERN